MTQEPANCKRHVLCLKLNRYIFSTINCRTFREANYMTVLYHEEEICDLLV